MILDGERIKKLLGQAKSEVIICAPFIKLLPFKLILGSVPRSVAVKVVTRWRAAEVALGVSDLEIFDVINDRENSELRLVNELHAKLYVADQKCLAGSANVTGAALGWSNQPNLELLLDVERSDLRIKGLIDRIKDAELATYQIRSALEVEVNEITNPSLEDILFFDEDQLTGAISPWLPQCAAPDKLFKVYQDALTNAVATGTLEDALSDLRALLPPKDLSEQNFVLYIASTLQELPSFQQIISRVPERVSDVKGEQLVAEIKPEMTPLECRRQWIIIRDWISVFMSDRIEVAPESFVVRLKSHKKE